MRPVTVVGMGPMGRAMAATLLRAGHPVSVWNRTPGRDGELVTAGATRAGTPVTGDLVLLSLTDYRAMYDVFGPYADEVAGRTLVNLSSDTPDTSREAAGWAAERGARFLTGGVMVPAPAVGNPGSFVFYSGPPEVYEPVEPVLRLLGEPRWLGADPGLAQLHYQAHLDVFLTALSGLLHATALAAAGGVRPSDFLPSAMGMLTGIPAMVGDGADLARRLEAGEHPGELSTVRMMGATAEHILRTSTRSGVETELPRAVLRPYERAIAAGHGDSNWTALYESLAGI